MARLRFIAEVIGPFHDLSRMVSNLKGVGDESTERVDRDHMRKSRLCCRTRKGTGEYCWCETHTVDLVAPGNAKRSDLHLKTRRSNDTEAGRGLARPLAPPGPRGLRPQGLMIERMYRPRAERHVSSQG